MHSNNSHVTFLIKMGSSKKPLHTDYIANPKTLSDDVFVFESKCLHMQLSE